MSDAAAISLRRNMLKFRAARRGFRELDLVMGAFAEANLAAMSDEDLDQFERLLDAPDQEVYAWITRRAQPPLEHHSPVLDALLAFRYPGPPE